MDKIVFTKLYHVLTSKLYDENFQMYEIMRIHILKKVMNHYGLICVECTDATMVGTAMKYKHSKDFEEKLKEYDKLSLYLGKLEQKRNLDNLYLKEQGL